MILQSMREMVQDEGFYAAIRELERWRDSLEVMCEIASPDELRKILSVYNIVRDTIETLIKDNDNAAANV